MQPYGRGKMLGSGINPESFKQDYSGFARAAEIQAQGMSNLGANIGGAIEEVGDYFKKQKEDEKKVQKSLSVAKAIGDLIPGLQPTIQGSLDILNDKEIPLSQRTAEADAISDILNLGINEVRNRQDIGFKERELGIREAEALARNATSQRSANLQLGEIRETINGKPYDVKVTFDPATGETRRLDGSIVSQGSRNPAIIDAGLNFSMPTAEGTAMPGDGTFPDYGGISDAMVLSPIDSTAIAAAVELTGEQRDVSNVSPMPMETPTTTQTPMVDGIPAGQAGAEMIPPGATLVEEEKETYTLTSDQVNETISKGGSIKVVGRDSDGNYTVESETLKFSGDGQTIEFIDPDGKTVRITSGGGVGGKEEKASALEEMKISKSEGIMRDLNILEDLSKTMAPGVIGAAGRMIAQEFPTTTSAKIKEIANRVVANLTIGTLQEMRNNSPTGGALGNVSDKDIQLLKDAATSLSNIQDPEFFKMELVRLKNLQHNVIYGSERVLRQKLAKNEISQSNFDAAMNAAPSQYLDERGAIRSRVKAPASSPFTLSPEAEDVSRRHPTGE